MPTAVYTAIYGSFDELIDPVEQDIEVDRPRFRVVSTGQNFRPDTGDLPLLPDYQARGTRTLHFSLVSAAAAPSAWTPYRRFVTTAKFGEIRGFTSVTTTGH